MIDLVDLEANKLEATDLTESCAGAESQSKLRLDLDHTMYNRR